jgi:hypothetical protein
MRVEQVDFVSVPARDVARAVGWYRDALGLPESRYAEGEVGFCEDPDGNTVILHRRYAPRG